MGACACGRAACTGAVRLHRGDVLALPLTITRAATAARDSQMSSNTRMSEPTGLCIAANTAPAAEIPMTLPSTSDTCSDDDVRPWSLTGERASESTEVDDMASPMPRPDRAVASPTR